MTSNDGQDGLQRESKTAGRRVWHRLGGMLSAPLNTMDGLLARRDADMFEPFALYAVIASMVFVAKSYQSVLLIRVQPLLVLRRLLDAFWAQGRTDLLSLAVIAPLVFLVLRFRGRPAGFLALVNTLAYLLVPLAFLTALSSAASYAGYDAWWMPHRPVHSWAVIESGAFSPVRYAVKIAVTYTWPLLLLLAWIWRRLSRPEHASGAAANIRVAVGLAVLSVGFSLQVMGAGSFLAIRADTLRPALPGDSLADVRLPWISVRPTDPRGALHLPSLKGEVLILDFWASWCPPCRREIPELAALAETYRGRVRIIGVNREPRNRSAAERALAGAAPGFVSVLDTQNLARKMGVQSLPTTYVIDRDGRIHAMHVGYTSPSTFKKELDALLAGPK